MSPEEFKMSLADEKKEKIVKSLALYNLRLRLGREPTMKESLTEEDRLKGTHREYLIEDLVRVKYEWIAKRRKKMRMKK